jgi:hypothetical protein
LPSTLIFSLTPLPLVHPNPCAEQIRKTADLTGIHVVDKETQWIMKADEDVTNGASLMLIQGMETQVLIVDVVVVVVSVIGCC